MEFTLVFQNYLNFSSHMNATEHLFTSNPTILSQMAPKFGGFLRCSNVLQIAAVNSLDQLNRFDCGNTRIRSTTISRIFEKFMFISPLRFVVLLLSYWHFNSQVMEEKLISFSQVPLLFDSNPCMNTEVENSLQFQTKR